MREEEGEGTGEDEGDDDVDEGGVPTYLLYSEKEEEEEDGDDEEGVITSGVLATFGEEGDPRSANGVRVVHKAGRRTSSC